MDQLQLKVEHIVRETEDCSSFFLSSQNGDPIDYEAGQFLTLLFYKNGLDIRRSYSLSSAPGIDKDLSITVKRKPNGQISRHLLDHVKRGDGLLSLPPAGRFTIESELLPNRQFFLIAAGSGIGPIFSLLKKVLAGEPTAEVLLIYQNHDENHIIFRNSLDKLSVMYAGRFRCISLLSVPPAPGVGPVRLTNFLLEQMIGLYLSPGKESLFYICGPLAFMRMVQFTLRLMGFGNDHIKKEHFTIDHVPPPPLMRDRSSKKITIHFKDQDYQIQASYPSTILEAALANHIQLPFSCRGGRCSTCAARCLQGTVVMSINEVLTEKDLREGWVLTCVGFAKTDIELLY